MKLYYDPISTTSRSVRFFLIDQKIPFSEEVVDLLSGEHLTTGFASLNPNRQVPVLVDDDFVLTESASILRYVAEKAGSSTYPTHLRSRARIDEAIDWFNTGFYTNFCLFLVYVRFLPSLQALSAQTRSELAHWGEGGARKYLDVLDRSMLSRGPYLCGDEISIADYFGIAYVSLGEAIGFDYSRYPNIDAWRRRMQGRDGWDAAYAAFSGFLRAMQNGMETAQ